MSTKDAPNPQLSVWLGDELRSEIEVWAKAQSPTLSLSKAVASLARTGLSATTLSHELVAAVEKHRSELALPYKPTRQQVVEALVWTALGRDASGDDLGFGRVSGPKG